MLDVHAPHEKIHGFRDFLLHLLTITIGLLIAVGIEGCVEWRHHKHLAHDAEVSLNEEIRSNDQSMQGVIDDLQKKQKTLAADLVVLQGFIDKRDMKNRSMEISFGMSTFNEVSWKTAQTTGAFAYMSYDLAQQYADIYTIQQEYEQMQQKAIQYQTESMAYFVSSGSNDSPDPTPEEAKEIKTRVQMLYSQLYVMSSFATTLDRQYKKFLTSHPS